MNISKKTSYAVMLSVIALLIGALVFSVVTIGKRNRHIADVENKLASEVSTNEQLNSENSRLSSDKTQLNEEKDKLSSELEKEKSEKNKLKKENSKLKSDIEKLKAKRKAEAKTAVNSASAAKPSATAKADKPKSNSTAPAKGKVAYLTFDDGPSANTLRILDSLEKYNAKATFFVINTDNISYVKNIKNAGHAIGLHSASHNYSKIYKSTNAYFSDLNKISDIVYSLTDERSRLIRFPGGSSNTVSKKYCKGIMTRLLAQTVKKGYYYFDWNVSSEDATANTVSYTKIVDCVLKGAKGKDTICVLMHDSAAKTTTADALPYILEGLSKQGFSFNSLSADAPGFKHGVNN